jgi:DNA mismatch repair protein MutL
MANHPPVTGSIRILSDDVARKIAAGEVIDRPAAVLRELLDNSLDAGASEISVYIKEGGCEQIRVVDNGTGMVKGDLELSVLSHATSKISMLQDLDRLATLGFRGEALSSIAACARLEITSGVHQHKAPVQRLLVEGGKQLAFEETPGLPGTVVDVSKIFYNMPARKRFLKRSNAETSMCKAVFLEKALAFPGVVFKLWIDGRLSLNLGQAGIIDRVRLLYADTWGADFFETTQADGDSFRITAVCARPEISHRDRKFMQIFVNRRRIFEYSLLQAVEYGYTGFMPGGQKPVAFVFIDIDPAFVDFNIHPAKREARFRNLPVLHNALVVLISSHLSKSLHAIPGSFDRTLPPDQSFENQQSPLFTPGEVFSKPINSNSFLTHARQGTSQREKDYPGVPLFEYLGRLFNVYLAATTDSELILIDQHAAHERILFDQLLERPRAVQELVIPVSFEAEEDERAALEENLGALEESGIRVAAIGAHSFEVRSLPVALQRIPEEELISFLKNVHGTVAELERSVLSLAACRNALKAGDVLDPVSAEELVKKALALPDPHCPHGRPVIARFSHDALDKLFKRLV